MLRTKAWFERGVSSFSFAATRGGEGVKPSCHVDHVAAWDTRAQRSARLAGEPARSLSGTAATTAAVRVRCASSAEARTPDSFFFGGRGLCDLETADPASAKGRPSAHHWVRFPSQKRITGRIVLKWQSARVDNSVDAMGGCGFASRHVH